MRRARLLLELAVALAVTAGCRVPRPVVPAEESRIARVEESLLPAVVIDGRGAGRPLPERMRHFGVGAVSLAVLDGGHLVWSRGYGGIDERSVLDTGDLAAGLDVPARATAADIARALARLPGGTPPLRRETRRHELFYDPGAGQGAVVLTDSDGGAPLCAEVLRSVAAEYRWPGYPGPVVKNVVPVEPRRLAGYAGRYQVGPSVELVVSVDAGRLLVTTPDGQTAELYPEGPDRFFLLDHDSRVSFERDADGAVTGLVATIAGRVIRAPRR